MKAKTSLADLQSLISDEDKKKIVEEKEKRDKQMQEAKEKIANLTVKEMNIAYFPAFIRMNFEELRSQPNDVLYELGREFKKYLEDVFKADLKKGEKIWDIEPITVVRNQMSDPFSMKGYHPALLFHFCEFMEKMKKEAEALIIKQNEQKK